MERVFQQQEIYLLYEMNVSFECNQYLYPMRMHILYSFNVHTLHTIPYTYYSSSSLAHLFSWINDVVDDDDDDDGV